MNFRKSNFFFSKNGRRVRSSASSILLNDLLFFCILQIKVNQFKQNFMQWKYKKIRMKQNLKIKNPLKIQRNNKINALLLNLFRAKQINQNQRKLKQIKIALSCQKNQLSSAIFYSIKIIHQIKFCPIFYFLHSQLNNGQDRNLYKNFYSFCGQTGQTINKFLSHYFFLKRVELKLSGNNIHLQRWVTPQNQM